MVIVRIQKIIYDNTTEKHILKHGVTISDIKKVVYSDAIKLESYLGRNILVNKVGDKIISVVSKIASNKLHIVTARDASKEEREIYYENKTDKTI